MCPGRSLNEREEARRTTLLASSLPLSRLLSKRPRHRDELLAVLELDEHVLPALTLADTDCQQEAALADGFSVSPSSFTVRFSPSGMTGEDDSGRESRPAYSEVERMPSRFDLEHLTVRDPADLTGESVFVLAWIRSFAMRRIRPQSRGPGLKQASAGGIPQSPSGCTCPLRAPSLQSQRHASRV
ncbi:hypothetical protein ASF71_20790 [Deinococcus sp. Leaf326]|nr:hypothetical protein ASF71_20790 [Deinococcus sp. Leaf326]